MELKLRELDAVEGDCARSNRTFMELKYVKDTAIYDVRLRSNRTFMELKFDPVGSTMATLSPF